MSVDASQSAGEERTAKTASQAQDALRRSIDAAMRKVNGLVSSYTPTSNMLNSLDGSVKIVTVATVGGRVISFEIETPVSNGVAAVSDVLVEAAIREAKDLDTTPLLAGSVEVRKFPVDLSKIVASRKDDIVTYTTPELPLWNMFTDVSALKDPINHQVVASAIVSSIRGYCLSGYSRVAEFSTMAFTLPVVREQTVEASLVAAAEIPGWNVPQTQMEADAQITMMNLQASGRSASELPIDAPSDHLLASQQRIQLYVAPAAIAFVAKELKGGGASVTAYDFSRMKMTANGAYAGTVLATVSFYSNNDIESAVLEVPVSDQGIVIGAEVKRSKMTLEASQKKAAEIKILSDEQAKQQFAEFKAKQEGQFETLVKAGYDFKADNAGLGSTLFNRPPSERIPVQRALLPLNANVPGKFIELGGYVYELCPTNYNTMGASEPDESPFLMLVLRPEKDPGSADAHSIYGTAELTAVAGR
jgi:hypothetical protein